MINNTIEIRTLLKELGITPELHGYHYLVYAIRTVKECFERGGTIQGDLCNLYTEIAKHYNTSFGAVERNMRTAVKRASDNPSEKMQELFSKPVLVNNGTFISVVAEYLVISGNS